MKHNIQINNMLKTLLFTLENGKSLSSAIELLAKTAQGKQEKKVYGAILSDIKDGVIFSSSLKKHKVGSLDIIQFVSMAESGLNFKESLKNIIKYIEVKEAFQRDTNEKTTLPFLYFSLAVIVVLGVKFFAIPYQMTKTMEGYSKEIMDLIVNHLHIAQVMTDVLFVLTMLVALFLSLLIVALFGQGTVAQAIAKDINLNIPFSSNIIKKFEKFMLFNMAGKMLQSGISYKNVIFSTMQTTTVKTFKQAFKNTLETIKNNGKFVFSSVLYDDLEKELLVGVGSSKQIGHVMIEISERARADALKLTIQFFRMITGLAMFLLTFAVFIEFWTVVLTQIIIEKGLIEMQRGGF